MGKRSGGHCEKDLRKIQKTIREAGWRVDVTPNGHYKAFAPDGKTIVTFVDSTSPRNVRNTRALFRRAGVKI